MSEDLISEFVKIEKEIIDSPSVFLKSAGYHLVSNLLGRYFSVPAAKNKTPNIWFVLSSKPKIFRRSTLHNHHQQVYRSALENHIDLDELNLELFGDEGKEDDVGYEYFSEFYNDTLMEDGSPEGIVDHLEGSKLEHYMIASHEFGGVINRMRSGYGSGTDTVYSKLYYGQGGIARFSRKGKGKTERRLPSGLYVTAYANMQDPTLYLKQQDAKQGFLRRLTLVYKKKRGRKYQGFWNDGIGSVGEEAYQTKLKKLGEKFSERMKKYEKMKKADEIQVGFETRKKIPVLNKTDEFRKKLEKIGRKVEEKLMANNGIVEHYVVSHDERLSKLACLRAISKDRIRRPGDFPFIEVTLDDLKESKKFLDEATEDLIDKLPEIEERKSRVRNIEPVKEKIVRLTGKKGVPKTQIINLSDLQAYSGMGRNDLIRHLKTMVAGGEIYVGFLKGVQGGSAVKVFLDKEEFIERMRGRGLRERNDDENQKSWFKIFNKNSRMDVMEDFLK